VSAQTTPADTFDAAAQARARAAYAAQAREGLDEKRIVDHLPLVRHVVQKVAAHLGGRVDLENLISAGTLGLVKAARAFDQTREAEFKTYAYIRIRGAVLDELRSQSFVPTAVHKQVRLAQQAYARFFQRAGRPPDEEELAGDLGVSTAQLYRTLEEARRQQFLSIHGLGGEREGRDCLIPVDASPGPDQQAQRKELVEKMTRAMRKLPARSRHILLLYYERDLTMKEVAEVLEVTESRVSQLHAGALFELSMRMKEST
jgi:RNA polymerase sigma factor for flagellar operon FliA